MIVIKNCHENYWMKRFDLLLASSRLMQFERPKTGFKADLSKLLDITLLVDS